MFSLLSRWKKFRQRRLLYTRKIAAQIDAVEDEYRPLYDKRCRMQRELAEKISTELMKNLEMAKLVDIYDK